MRNLIILLGAGASYDFGAPLMKDFYRVAAEIKYLKQDDKEEDYFATVFKFIDNLQKAQAKANLDLHNIEQVYTALEMAKLLGRDNLKVKGKDWKYMDTAMKFFLTQCIESKTSVYRPPNRFNQPTFPTNEALYKAVSEVKKLKERGWEVSFISFNYDLVIESILATLYCEVNYGLKEQININPNQINLFKLHGSINWATPSQDKGEIEIHSLFEQGKPLHHDYIISPQNQASNFKIRTRFSKNIVPFVVPPVWNKASYHEPLQKVWKEAAKTLSEASFIYCLGYSLPQTDGFFNQLFALGTVGRAPLMEFKVFDIESPDTIQGVNHRYKNLLGVGGKNVYSYHEDGAEGLLAALKSL